MMLFRLPIYAILFAGAMYAQPTLGWQPMVVSAIVGMVGCELALVMANAVYYGVIIPLFWGFLFYTGCLAFTNACASGAMHEIKLAATVCDDYQWYAQQYIAGVHWAIWFIWTLWDYSSLLKYWPTSTPPM